MPKRSMSVSHGDPAGHGHNIEAEYRARLENVDPTRSALNEVLVDVPLAALYEREFGAALAAYNAQQVEKGHPERQIADYLGKIRAGKQERPVYECVVQIGNKDTNPATDEACRLGSSVIYREFLERFEREFPQLKVHQAALHMDEATPHLHIAYVPVSRGNKRGLETKNSLTGAYRQMGFHDVRDANERMFSILEEVAAEHGVERLDMGCDRGHLTVRDFKEMQDELRGKEYPYRNDPRLMRLVIEQQEQIEELLEVGEAQQVAIESLVRHEPSHTNMARMREAVAEARAARDELAPRIEAARSMGAKFQACIKAVPQWWRDNIINPVSEALRAAVSRDHGHNDDEGDIRLNDEARSSREASAVLNRTGERIEEHGRGFGR